MFLEAGLEPLLLLLLLEELLATRTGGHRGWLPELLPALELLLLLLELLGSKLLLLLLYGLEVGRQGVDLPVLVLVPGEAVQGDVLPGQLRDWLQYGLLGLKGELLLRSKLSLLLGSELLLLLRSKLLLLPGSKLSLLLRGQLLLLLLGSKLLLLLRCKLLRLLLPLLELLELGFKGRPLLLLLLPGGKLLLLPGGKLLLLLRGELLLLLLRGKLLLLRGKLLLLLELLKVLVEVLGVELVSGRLVGVELGSVEDGPAGVLSALVGELTPLGGVVPLAGDLVLPLNDAGLVVEHSSVPLGFQGEGRAGSDRLKGRGAGGRGGRGAHSVGGESGSVVGGVLHNDNVAQVVQVAVLALDIALLVPGLQLEGSVGSFIADSVCSVLVDLVDLLEDDGRVLRGGGECEGG